MALISGFGINPNLPQPPQGNDGEFEMLYSLLLRMLNGGASNGAAGEAAPAAAPAMGASPSVLPRMQEQMQGLDQVHEGWQGFAGAGNAGNSGGSAAAPAASAGGGDRPVVAVLDDFNSSHGAEIAGIIHNGGADTLNLNVNNGGDRVQGISAGLDQVLARLQKGQSIDAVNLSQQALTDGMENEQVRKKIQEIQKLGVPVVVAAGNGGQNTLARGAALQVENSNGGNGRAGSSGSGNIRAQGSMTSQATASVAAQAAQLHKQGASVQQTQQQLQKSASSQGGSLH